MKLSRCLISHTVLGCAALLLSGCSSATSGSYEPFDPVDPIEKVDGPPTQKPKINMAAIPNAKPRPLPYSRYGNPKSYQALGKTYHVLATGNGYDKKGIASWYGMKFHGKLTSTREPYNMYAMTAAMKTIPIPSFAQVTNLENGKQVIVKVNDRGPFKERRIIDLSYAAAWKLGMLKKGTAPVEVKIINPQQWQKARSAIPEKPWTASPASSIAAPIVVAASTPAKNLAPDSIAHKATNSLPQPQIFVQVAAFNDKQNANRTLQKVRAVINQPSEVQANRNPSHPVFRVQVGPLATVALSDSISEQLEQAGFTHTMTVVK